MNEPDDRLAGDPAWELFPDPSPRPERGATWSRRHLTWPAIAATWFVSPPLSVVAACLAVAARDLRAGRRLARSIPDEAGGAICSLFAYAWGAWKLGVAAFASMFAAVALDAAAGRGPEPPAAFLAAMLLWLGGFAASALLTAAGLLRASRSGMRVWVGEGINRARTLLLGMLLAGFTAFVLLPMCLWLVGRMPRAGGGQGGGMTTMLLFFGCIYGGPVALLVLLDWFCRRVVADRPGKFGPKVPTVGRWDA